MAHRHLPRAAALSATAAALALLTACGGTSSSDADKYPAAPSTVIKIEGSVKGGGTTSTTGGRGGETPPTEQGCKGLNKPFEHVNACNPVEVATNALRVMYSPRPVTDRSPADAILRAAPLLSTAMIASAQTSAGSASQNAGTGEFASLRASRKQVVATVTAQKEGRSTLYRIDRKAVPDGNADDAGQPLTTVFASVVLHSEPDMGGYRLDSVNIIE